MQAAAALHDKLRKGNFELLPNPPRMLPRMFDPTQLNVDCSAKTPAKEDKPKGTKRGRGRGRGGASGIHLRCACVQRMLPTLCTAMDLRSTDTGRARAG